MSQKQLHRRSYKRIYSSLVGSFFTLKKYNKSVRFKSIEPPSSSGPGHQILILKITGSTPVGGTVFNHHPFTTASGSSLAKISTKSF